MRFNRCGSNVMASPIERLREFDRKPLHLALIRSWGKDGDGAGWHEIGEVVDGGDAGHVMPSVPKASPDRPFCRHQTEAVTEVDPRAAWNFMPQSNAVLHLGKEMWRQQIPS